MHATDKYVEEIIINMATVEGTSFKGGEQWWRWCIGESCRKVMLIARLGKMSGTSPDICDVNSFELWI